MQTNTTQPGDSSILQAAMRRRAAQVAGQVLVQATLLFASAGTLRWGWAWAFLGVYLVMIAANAWFLLRRSPETIAERGRTAENWKAWDKVVGVLFALAYFAGLLVVAGLDLRFGWTDGLALGWHLLGLAGFAAGGALFSWAMIENAFFSTIVRIQDDRGQAVCYTGPYRVVRHPGYLGGAVEAVTLPLLLGSLWALVPGVLAAALLVLRAALEDRTLCRELPGYAEYAERTRQRLIPGLW